MVFDSPLEGVNIKILASERGQFTRTELETALERGEFKVLAWAAAVAFVLRHL